MKTLWDENQNFCLKEDDSGQLWLEVVVGTIGLYTVEMPLTPKEVSAYRRRCSSIRTLSAKVRFNPDLAEKRKKKWLTSHRKK